MQKADFRPPWISKAYRKLKPFAANGRKKRQAFEIQGGRFSAFSTTKHLLELFAKRIPMEKV